MATTTLGPIDAAEALVPLIREHADAIERERRLPAPVSQALVEAGIFRLFVPRALGGAEVDPATACHVVEAVSRADGAAGWCAMIGACYGVFGALLPDDGAREIFSDPATVGAGAFRITGIAREVEGGYQVSGRWPLGSGIMHANWVLGGCRVFDGDEPRLGANGMPERRILFFPPAEVQILDTWHVAGLRGTGSHDYVVNDLFVPAHRACWFSQPPRQPGPLYTMPAIALFAGLVASVPLGIARHAFDVFTEIANAKKVIWSQESLGSRPTTHVVLGEAEGLLRAGRAFLFEQVNLAWGSAMRGEQITWEQRGLLWLAATQAATQAARAVDLLFKAAGTTSIYASSQIERCWRDVHTAAQHICLTTANYEFAGRLFLGLDVLASPWGVDNRGDA